MKRSLVILIGTIFWSVAYVDVSRGAIDAFLLIQGLKGESTVNGRVDWTNIRTVTSVHGLPSVLGVTTSTAKVVFQPIAVVKFTDSLSPALAMAAASGQPFPTVVVELTKTFDTSRPVFLRLELFDVRIAAYSVSANVQGEVTTEEIRLSYNRIRWTSYKIAPNGQQLSPPFVGGWDLVNNKGF